jgi:site-specific recombinase
MKISLDQIGKMGHREVSRSYHACLRLLLSAGGAGFVTAGTVIFKMRILYAPLSLLGGGVLAMVNFVASFLLMQLLGFRLATKQSPLLGASLARRWREKNEILWSYRTQAASAAGNLSFVLASAFAFQVAYQHYTGNSFLTHEAAVHALQSVHPWKSASIPYAALTGGILWACMMSGGAVASRFKPFSKSMATALFNIGLGATLAFAPVIGKSLGIPLDVRHFTLSGGLVAMATASLGFKDAWNAGLLAAFSGVLVIGTLNFTVSAALSFLSASSRPEVCSL